MEETQQQGVDGTGEEIKNSLNSFRPSLLKRIIFEGGARVTKEAQDAQLSREAAAIMGAFSDQVSLPGAAQAGGGVVAGMGDPMELPPALAGADRKQMRPFTHHFLARAFLRIFILSLAMYLASRTVGSQFFQEVLLDKIDTTGMFKTADEDAGFSFKDKYKAIIVVIAFFIGLTVVYNWILSWVPYLLLYLYYSAVTRPGEKVKDLAQLSFKYIFDQFIAKEINGDMKFYMSIQSYAIWGLLIFFIIYAFFARSFIMTMKYPDYNMGNGDGEVPWPRKFLMHHMVVVVFAIMFMVGLFVFHFGPRDIQMIAYTAMIVCLYSLVLCQLVLYNLKKSPFFIDLIIILVLLFIVLFNYYVLLYR